MPRACRRGLRRGHEACPLEGQSAQSWPDENRRQDAFRTLVMAASVRHRDTLMLSARKIFGAPAEDADLADLLSLSTENC
jgi:hypothetical protein